MVAVRDTEDLALRPGIRRRPPPRVAGPGLGSVSLSEGPFDHYWLGATSDWCERLPCELGELETVDDSWRYYPRSRRRWVAHTP